MHIWSRHEILTWDPDMRSWHRFMSGSNPDISVFCSSSIVFCWHLALTCWRCIILVLRAVLRRPCVFENCWLPPADGGLVAGSGVGGETVSPGAQWSAAIPPTTCSSGETACSLWRRIFSGWFWDHWRLFGLQLSGPVLYSGLFSSWRLAVAMPTR